MTPSIKTERRIKYMCHTCEDGVERSLDFLINHCVAKHGFDDRRKASSAVAQAIVDISLETGF